MYAVAIAQLPEPPAGADRIFRTENSVIVLDGASSFSPGAPDPAAYADTLGQGLQDVLTADPAADLVHALATAIASTTTQLAVTPGRSPSSTVAIARWSADTIDLLVLGDTQITTPHGVLLDDRLGDIAASERHAYRARLRQGHGYDERHRALLTELQAEQERRRNKPNGYWIAEADPAAADHALTERHPVQATPWLVIATDGAYNPLDHLGIAVAPDSADSDLANLLGQCRHWEAEHDPAGDRLPRAKRHDDKSIAVLRRTES